jgi:hypothetical protein
MIDRRRLGPKALSALLAEPEPWLSCDDCFDQTDAVIDGLLTAGIRPPERFRTHLHHCPVCREETLILLQMAADDWTDLGSLLT